MINLTSQSDLALPAAERQTPHPEPRYLLHRALLWWGGMQFALWTSRGLFEAAQTWFLANMLDRGLSVLQCVLLSLAMWYGLGLLAPVMWWLARRCPLEQQSWSGPLAVLLLA